VSDPDKEPATTANKSAMRICQCNLSFIIFTFNIRRAIKFKGIQLDADEYTYIDELSCDNES
jgi:hypothetical protein